MILKYILFGIAIVCLIIMLVVEILLIRMRPETTEKHYARMRVLIRENMDTFSVCDGPQPPEWKEIHVYSPDELGLNVKGGAWDAK